MTTTDTTTPAGCGPTSRTSHELLWGGRHCQCGAPAERTREDMGRRTVWRCSATDGWLFQQ